jgi:hypothetical protein
MYPMKKNGFEFRFEDQGLTVVDPFSKETHFSFLEQLKFHFQPYSKKIRIKGSKGSVNLEFSKEELSSFALDFFQRWKRVQPELAKKAAFDYIDGQKGFVSVAFFLSVFFAFPLTVGFLADSQNQFYCTKVLQQNAAVGEMQVVKYKKKRKGHYILDLAFTAPNGSVITGRDQVITPDETKIPKSVPVVFSPEQPSCWSLTPNLEGSEVNWAKRRYFGSFTLMFGLFFLASSLYGLIWSAPRLFRKKPLLQELAKEFQL